MRTEGQTSQHLLLAVITTIFSGIIIALTLFMKWEIWVIALIAAGCFTVWCLHVAKTGSNVLYENLCAGLMLAEFFFFGVHESSLFDIATISCVLIIVLFMLNKKWIVYMIDSIYVLTLLYHAFILHTISYPMDDTEMFRLFVGAIVTFSGTILEGYWINRRNAQKKMYEGVFEELETAGKQNAVLLSNVSHEFRTPINMVIGISDVALGKDLSPDIRRDMMSIKKAGQRLSNQISNMLDYTEVMEGTVIPVKKEYMITSVLNDLITMTALLQNRRNLELVFDIDPKMPAALIGDSEKIFHVLKILMENAIKFTETGGVNVRIKCRKETYGVNLIVDIRDTGIGMTDAQLQQIYQVFYQVDSKSSRYAGGLGLGLPIAQGILKAMGGFIHFNSNRKQGLRARVVIPQGLADDQPCIVLNHVEEFCVACYFKPEKFSCDDVREYYDGLIVSLLEGLGLKGYQAHNFEGFLKLHRTYALTHAFIVQSEYEINREYYEELAKTVRVIVIANSDFTLESGSNLLIIHKPFSALSVANILNGEFISRKFAEAQAAGHKPFTCTGIRALAVDDEEMNLIVSRGMLGSYGIEVDTCLSGRDAIEKCTDNSYDIIFLDHMMPGLDGVETLKKIRELHGGRYQDLPIIALTANTVSGAREMFHNEGFTEFVPKPIERTILERVLRKVLPKSCIQYVDTVANVAAPVEYADPVPAEGWQKEFLDELNAVVVNEGAEAEDHTGLPQTGADAPSSDMSSSDAPLVPYDKLIEAGIDVKLGLEYCNGEEEFYREMLQMFCSQGEDKRQEIIALYESANWADYAVKVHALKSTSLTIGAQALSAQAKELEMAGKKGDTRYIQEHHAALLRAHEELCAYLAGI